MLLYASDYMADAQDDDYSGGLESPEPQDGDSVDFNSPTSPELQACHLYTKIKPLNLNTCPTFSWVKIISNLL